MRPVFLFIKGKSFSGYKSYDLKEFMEKTKLLPQSLALNKSSSEKQFISFLIREYQTDYLEEIKNTFGIKKLPAVLLFHNGILHYCKLFILMIARQSRNDDSRKNAEMC